MKLERVEQKNLSRCHCGMDFGWEPRVIIEYKDRLLVYTKGRCVWSGMYGTQYSEGTLSVTYKENQNIRHNQSHIHILYTGKQENGTKLRFGKKLIVDNIAKILQSLGLPADPKILAVINGMNVSKETLIIRN